MNWSAYDKASLFSAPFDAIHCRDSIQQPHSCDASLALTSFGFQSSFVRSLLLYLDPYARSNPD